MNFVDEWRHFGRPSGVAILKDDTLIVVGLGIEPVDRRPAAGAGRRRQRLRNPGWKNGIRIGSAKDGSLSTSSPARARKGMAADELGNIFGGLTGGCDTEPVGRLPAEVREAVESRA